MMMRIRSTTAAQHGLINCFVMQRTQLLAMAAAFANGRQHSRQRTASIRVDIYNQKPGVLWGSIRDGDLSDIHSFSQ
jgi:hypothetical protein